MMKKNPKMNNCTVDVSVFLLNEDDFLKADEKRKGTLVKNVCRAIDSYTVLCASLDNAVFFPKFNTNEFLQKLENNAFREYHEEIEKLLNDNNYTYHDYRKKIQNIIDNYQTEDGEHQRDWRQSFNNQFYIQWICHDIHLIEEPDNDIRETYGENFVKTLSSIALLNSYIYDNDYNRHLFLYSGLKKYEELNVNVDIKGINIADGELKKIVKPGEFKGTVKKKSLKTPKKTPLQFNTLHDAVEQARNDFSNNLIFGNDIDKGVKERNNNAGPPAKVYYYLKTLNEITEIKKNIHPDFSLVLLARMYGCNCSGESGEIMYDDGNGKSGFTNHLKPAESKYPYYVDHFDDGYCIRIYFKWSEERKKTIVGWIGKHP
jgi:hypothetical protein